MFQNTRVFILRKKGFTPINMAFSWMSISAGGKGVSERSGLMPGLVYTWVGLFTTLEIFSIS